MRQDHSPNPEAEAWKGRLEAPIPRATFDSSSGFEKGSQGKSQQSPWRLREALAGPQAHLAEVTFGTGWPWEGQRQLQG